MARSVPLGGFKKRKNNLSGETLFLFSTNICDIHISQPIEKRATSNLELTSSVAEGIVGYFTNSETALKYSATEQNRE